MSSGLCEMTQKVLPLSPLPDSGETGALGVEVDSEVSEEEATYSTKVSIVVIECDEEVESEAEFREFASVRGLSVELLAQSLRF